jgi:predicted Zn finger-like uncharacterized protein
VIVILQCPACQARYLLPDQAIGATGRTVRCAKCAHSWFQAPSESAKAVDDLKQVLDKINAKPKPIPPGSNLPVVRREATPLSLRLSVAAIAAVAAALLILVIHPGTFGLPASKGLVLADAGLTKLSVNNHVVYEINGKITNATANLMAVPTVRVTLLDGDNITLKTWDFANKGKTLEAGKDLPFTTGNLEIPSTKAARFSVDLGNPLELALRRKPE